MIGVHSSKKSLVLDNKRPRKTLSDAINDDTSTLDLNAVQIFTHGPMNSTRNNYNTNDIIKTTKNIEVTVHSSYTMVQIWKYQTLLDKAKAVSNITSQLSACNDINARYYVLHITKHPIETISYVMNEIIKPIAKKYKITIALEMVASKAHKTLTYESPKKINKLTKAIPGKWWCWCVDTAHLWGAGVNITSYIDMNKWLSGISDRSRIKLFHLNGSSAKLGSGKDKHEIAFTKQDNIWHNTSYNTSGLRAVVEFAKKYNSTIILEVKRGKQKDIEALLNTIKH